ncbi:hypothetical protein cgR_1921 [Corynebacterium glutamicum R]|uniref:HTH cro/C1-type domain-containing protein n=3 Tax=Corynebacterium glutamicum TaxID=1718 RepID=Q5KRG3_CORGT|nr:hypothetical protein [Corynebacterium glutamicum]BAF54916.1 hypothetical protein cgR_1921 [Corynebacterium glutamicum R]
MNGQTAKEAADQTGISASNFTRWKKGARADPDFVVKIARAYNANVLDALVKADFITEDEAKLTEVSPTLDLTKVSGEDLMNEVERRIEALRYLDSLAIPRTAPLVSLADKHRNANIDSPRVRPLSDDEIADAIREANERPQAAHPATEELTEPDHP